MLDKINDDWQADLSTSPVMKFEVPEISNVPEPSKPIATKPSPAVYDPTKHSPPNDYLLPNLLPSRPTTPQVPSAQSTSSTA